MKLCHWGHQDCQGGGAEVVTRPAPERGFVEVGIWAGPGVMSRIWRGKKNRRMGENTTQGQWWTARRPAWKWLSALWGELRGTAGTRRSRKAEAGLFSLGQGFWLYPGKVRSWWRSLSKGVTRSDHCFRGRFRLKRILERMWKGFPLCKKGEPVRLMGGGWCGREEDSRWWQRDG